jgi:pectate lyase
MNLKIMKCFAAAALTVAMMGSLIPASAAQELSVLTGGSSILTSASQSSVIFTASGGDDEEVYAEWSAVSGASGYNVYVKPDGGSYTQIDSMLIRQYADCFRADAVGLAAGKYTLKVVPVIDGTEAASKSSETSSLTVTQADRSGFAFSDSGLDIGNGVYGCGGYNADGTLSEDAQVLYITADTVNTVTLDVITSSKGKLTTCTGLADILTARKKGYDLTPLVIRVIGEITSSDIDGLNSNGYLEIKGCTNVTLEGIGEDATANGWGILVRQATNVEIKNIGVLLFPDDGISLDTGNTNIWIHNCDIFYGTAGSDADQAKGDGSMDVKNDSSYITFSYNHFWDSGKCSLCGMKSETGENWITYHHNWFDHSDSRHPRIRTMSVHVYNNYYDGNSKYGVGVTSGASCFVENNYFRNCKYPMLSSQQGTDADGEGTFSGEDGGMIKAFGNYIESAKSLITQNDTSDKTDIDCYLASDRNEQVPSAYTTAAGGTTYNNFDTSSIMYSYTADAAEDVPDIVTSKAGRLNGGDIEFTFNNSVDDASYAINTELMQKLVSYSSSVIAIGSGFTDSTEASTETSADTTTAPTESTTEQTSASTEQTSYSQVIYCAPDASGSGKSTADPADVMTAIENVPAGGIIYLLEGTYTFTQTIKIAQSNSGTADAVKTISAYPGAEVIFDFSALSVADANRGVVMDGNYWHWYGFEIYGAGDNGMLLSGSNNTIEMMVFNNNQDTGLQISRYRSSAETIEEWPSNNLILNCTSKNNCDDETMENADGFAAKLTCGEGNVFDGCMSYNNSDDGWDLYAKEATGSIGVVTIRNCIAFRNGYTEYGEGYGECDGNGFKLGGGGVGTAHIVENCLAFENLNCGFTDNNNPKLESLTNCTSYNNGVGGNGKPNYSVYRCIDDGCDFTNIISYINETYLNSALAPGLTSVSVANDKFVGTMQNSVYYNGGKYYRVTSQIAIENGDKTKDIVSVSDSDFISMTAPAMGSDFHKLWRNGDGSLNTGGFLQTTESSAYAEMGYKLSLEYIEATDPVLPTDPTESEEVTDATDTSVLYGDVNCNGEVNILDVIALNKNLLGGYSITEEGMRNADVDLDGTPTTADALNIMRYVVKLIDSLPVA